MREKKKRGKIFIKAAIAGAAAVVVGCGAAYFYFQSIPTPQELLVEYMNHIPKGEYEEMYGMLDQESSGNISREEFIKRNSAIYEGIEVSNMKVELMDNSEKRKYVGYRTTLETMGGTVSFENEARFVKIKGGYGLSWSDSLIFPQLESTDKVRVTTTQAERGQVLDRNGRVLAGKGVASSVGIVPMKLEDDESAMKELGTLLDMEPETIQDKLEASWVKEDSFVPIATIPKVQALNLLKMIPDEELAEAEEQEKLQERLLKIPGVMITDTEVREYPLGEAASHLTGYVQNVTAEDLEEHPGEGYTANSVIGRSGMESLFEKELKGQDGCCIYIEDEEGNHKAELADRPVQHGQNIQLTIDAELQEALYEQFQEDKSCSVALNPYTGEVLALVSTPSYDSNDFIRGMSQQLWTELNEDERKPLYNRFRQVWCPGSTFKPIIAAIGIKTGAVNPTEDFGNVGLSWQKDSSWGSYYVTTLHDYEPVTMENALIYSDNIYFAKAALRIGAEGLEQALTELGFQEELPFEITMSVSQYSNTEHIETEIQLADSGYGQGQILINPLHLASLYTLFCNEGNVMKPYLVYRDNHQDKLQGEVWYSQAFSQEISNTVLEGMKQVINNPNGTGYGAHREDMTLAGKTGTAEIKASADDTTGTELGWFAISTTDSSAEKPILLVSMVEDVKDRGGSGYVVDKDTVVLDQYFGK